MLKIIEYSISFIIFSIITSLLVLYFYLLKGFSIENIHFNNVSVSQLYIKIDKKIILKSKNIFITLPKSKKTSKQKEINFNETHKTIKKVLQYLNFFQEIDIENLNIDKNKISLISLKQNNFVVDTDDIFIKASIKPEHTKTFFNIKNFNLKKFDINFENIQGEIYSDFRKLNIDLKNYFCDVSIDIHLTITNKTIKYKGNLYNVTNKFLKKFDKHLDGIKIDKFDIYKIAFKGNLKKVNIKSSNFYFDINNNKIKIPKITLNYYIKNNTLKSSIPKIYLITKEIPIELFNTDLTLINNKKLTIQNEKILITKDNNLITLFSNSVDYDFKTIRGNIQKFNIINNVVKLNSNNINIKFDKKLFLNTNLITLNNKELKAKLSNINLIYNPKTKKLFIKNKGDIRYKNIPIKIDTLKTFYDFNRLLILIPKVDLNKTNLTNIVILLKNNLLTTSFETNALLSKKLINSLKAFGIKIPIYQKNGKNKIVGKINYDLKLNKLDTDLDIKINNSKLMLTKDVGLYIYKSNLNLNNSKIFLKNTLLDFNKSIVNLTYDIDDGIIDLDKFYIKTDGKFKDLNLTNILEIKNYPEKLYIDLNKINILLKNLNVKIGIGDDIIVKLNRLSNFTPYISYLNQYGINNGKIDINISNKIAIKADINETNQTILEQNLTPIKKLLIDVVIDDKNITIKNNKLKFNIINDKNLTLINGGFKNLDLNITKFIDTNKTEDNSSSINISTLIKAKNTYIVYNNLKLYSNQLSINYDKNHTKIYSLFKDRNITITIKDGNLKLYGLKIKEKTFKDLTNTNILNNPLLTIFALKNKNSELLQGFIEIHKGYIKELKAFNNILAFINLIPSLVTFQPVGFSSKGYKIKHGYIEYIFYDKILYFKQIHIKGENMSFDGNGYIDLNKNIIKMNINVNLIVKLVKDIPIVNYILLGKDGGITLKLTIDGDLNNPKVHSNTAANIIQAPLGIIKRTLLTPFRPFINNKE